MRGNMLGLAAVNTSTRIDLSTIDLKVSIRSVPQPMGSYTRAVGRMAAEISEWIRRPGEMSRQVNARPSLDGRMAHHSKHGN